MSFPSRVRGALHIWTKSDHLHNVTGCRSRNEEFFMAIRKSLRDVAAKVVGKDSEHVSRFHSRRGDLCNPADLLAIPGLVWRRLAGKAHDSPWMTPDAVRHLDQRLSADDVILELGSGASTAWYARRVRRVVSLEPN